MRWTTDPTGRFKRRPYHTIDELDRLFEDIVFDAQIQRHGRVSYPISTDDLTVLIEERAQELDLYADLSNDGPDVEGKTLVEPGHLPKVAISRLLSEDPSRETRFRFTLAHEGGHVVLHTRLEIADVIDAATTFDSTLVFKIFKQEGTYSWSGDWVEWQADFAAGSILMPRTHLFRLLHEFQENHKLACAPLPVNSAHAVELERLVASSFGVSRQAARIRLELEGIVIPHLPMLRFFRPLSTPRIGLEHCSRVLPRILDPVGLMLELPRN